VKLQSAFDLVRVNVSKEQRQKYFYDIKVHGNPFQKEDLVLLRTPAVKKGHPINYTTLGVAPFRLSRKYQNLLTVFNNFIGTDMEK